MRHAWASRSTSSTRLPSSANAAPSEATEVVLATPPFWLATATTAAPVRAVRPAGPRAGTSLLSHEGRPLSGCPRQCGDGAALGAPPDGRLPHRGAGSGGGWPAPASTWCRPQSVSRPGVTCVSSGAQDARPGLIRAAISTTVGAAPRGATRRTGRVQWPCHRPRADRLQTTLSDRRPCSVLNRTGRAFLVHRHPTPQRAGVAAVRARPTAARGVDATGDGRTSPAPRPRAAAVPVPAAGPRGRRRAATGRGQGDLRGDRASSPSPSSSGASSGRPASTPPPPAPWTGS